MAARRPVISLLEADPDLGEGLTPELRAVARRQVLAPLEMLEPGPWDPMATYAHERPTVGLLVIEGLLTRDLAYTGRTTTDLVGAGDLLRPWDQDVETASFSAEVSWRVLEPTHLAVLDLNFATVVGRWPSILDALFGRVAKRARWLTFQLALGQATRVDSRLLILFWQLADRWGRVGPDGVLLPLRLTHEILGKLVGARRPSVTTALSTLTELGFLQRTPDGWLLVGDAAEQFEVITGAPLDEAAPVALAALEHH